jgi:hypothetical protein
MTRALRSSVPAALALFAHTATAQSSVSITPATHDFGRVAVGALREKLFTLGGATRGDAVVALLEGNDAAHWVFASNGGMINGNQWSDPCLLVRAAPGPPTCTILLDFRPRWVGPKRAVLRVTDAKGGTATAVLTGMGVPPLCTVTLVPCNYAHLYDGTFSWKIHLQGQAGSDELGIQVAITEGEAVCTGTQVSRGPGGTSWTGSIVGPGLFAVEFIPDPLHTLAYRFTVACPSARFPDHVDGSSGRDSEPAKLGSSYSIVTDPQPARVIGEPLAGAVTYPAPESDPDNGVSGTVAVQWNLWRPGQPPPSPPARPGASGPP